MSHFFDVGLYGKQECVISLKLTSAGCFVFIISDFYWYWSEEWL